MLGHGSSRHSASMYRYMRVMRAMVCVAGLALLVIVTRRGWAQQYVISTIAGGPPPTPAAALALPGVVTRVKVELRRMRNCLRPKAWQWIAQVTFSSLILAGCGGLPRAGSSPRWLATALLVFQDDGEQKKRDVAVERQEIEDAALSALHRAASTCRRHSA